MEERIIEEEFAKSEQLLFSEYCDVKNMMDRSDAYNMMKYYLNALNLDISKLKFVHITGSKGKGTTCSYIERALHFHGLKTGLFTSPHVQSLCERFQINGKMISKEVYLKHFYPVWNKLQEIKQMDPSERPSYITNWPGFFRFLTIMAFELFLEEQVDVVILEVGMGGRLDSTNVIDTALATGISLIDLEHTEVLGHTYEAIAKEKGGIFKPNSPAFVLKQREDVMETLSTLAHQIRCIDKCPITFVSPSVLPVSIQEIIPSSFPAYLLDNFCLAYSISQTVLTHFSLNINETIMKKVLLTTSVPARAQIIKKDDTLYYIDGAHTPMSIRCACTWFNQCLEVSSSCSQPWLVFYCGRDKNCQELIQELVQLPFSQVVLCMVKHPKPEYMKVELPSIEEVIEKYGIDSSVLFDEIDVNEEAMKEEWLLYLAKIWRIEERVKDMKKKPIVLVKNMDDVMKRIQEQKPQQVCCTGSLYLCGDLLNDLE